MLKYPCLVLDHDDTVVQSEATINYPFFCQILDQFRPGEKITLEEYAKGCFFPGFAAMCRERYQFTDQELYEEYLGWKEYVRSHIPDVYPGIKQLIHRQKEAGGIICVVSHSSIENITRDYQSHFGILPDAIYGWELPETQRKPSSYPLEHIMRTYRLAPHELLVVDDMKLGYDMAKKVDVPIAFSGWGRKDFPEISGQMKALCDFSFETAEELEHFLFN